MNRYSLLDGAAHFEENDFARHGGGLRLSTKDLGEFAAAAGPPLLKRNPSPPPLLVRKATYSSLPPSPSALSNPDFENLAGPRSVTEGASSYLETYDQQAFAHALQKVLEGKRDLGLDERVGMDARKVRAASLPPEDVASEHAIKTDSNGPDVVRDFGGGYLKAPPLSRSGSRIRAEIPPSSHESPNAHGIVLPASEPRQAVEKPSPVEAEKRGTLQPLWQMITDEMNVEQNRLFVIEGKW